MLTLRSAAALLFRAETIDGLAPIAASLGLGHHPLPLDPDTIAALGIPRDYGDVRIGAGAGALRALMMSAPPGESVPDGLTRLAACLDRRAPHLLILVVLRSSDGASLGLAAWSGDRRAPRVAALLVDRHHVLDSDAETLCTLAAAADGVDVSTHARWVELLGREAISRRFYHALERVVSALADSVAGSVRDASARRELALLHASRLVFLAFLEAKGWLDGDRGFLSRQYDACMSARGGFHQRVLLPLLFGTLNTPAPARSAAARAFGLVPFLNGGLFARTPLEQRQARARFTDESIGRLFSELLGRYRFTPREAAGSMSEAAIDPEILGRAFESLMAAGQRRSSGTYFTPQSMVSVITREAFLDALAGADASRGEVEALLDGAVTPRDEASSQRSLAALGARIASVRILDPACGSGAFLVYALELLASLRARLGDQREPGEIRRDVLSRSIFGVDINPTAVWLCELRLWLSVVIDATADDPRRIQPLPNLDHHIRVGDALAGGAFAGTAGRAPTRFARLRERYVRATGARKQQLARALDREERAHALDALAASSERTAAARRSLLAAVRGHDLFGDRTRPDATVAARLDELRGRARHERAQARALRAGAALPFSFAAHFADAAAAGGFDIIVGNPPWVRLHRIPPPERALLRHDFVVYRQAAWARGAAAARAGAGFAAQVDVAALFVEQSLALLKGNGTAALLLPAKLWRSLAGGGVRALLLRDTHLVALEDWSHAPAIFDAAVYPSLLVARRRSASDGTDVALARPISAAVHPGGRPERWSIARDSLALDESAGSPWLLVPRDVRRAFDRLTASGHALADSQFGRPLLGVKSGCNDAFIAEADPASVAEAAAAGDAVEVRAGDRVGFVEATLLRPLLRGEYAAAWTRSETNEFILWTHGADGTPLDRLPPLAERWLRPWRRTLESRTDGRGRARWWSLFRTDGAATRTPRVVWNDIGHAPRALVLDAGDPAVALNSCYVVRCRDLADAHALVAVLNAPVAAAWLAVLAEPARGGYRRYLGWTMSLLPVPMPWLRARTLLAPLAIAARNGHPVSTRELTEAAANAYGIDLGTARPLLEWAARC